MTQPDRRCQCHPHEKLSYEPFRCNAEMTQEDLLCGHCREGHFLNTVIYLGETHLHLHKVT